MKDKAIELLSVESHFVKALKVSEVYSMQDLCHLQSKQFNIKILFLLKRHFIF